MARTRSRLTPPTTNEAVYCKSDALILARRQMYLLAVPEGKQQLKHC